MATQVPPKPISDAEFLSQFEAQTLAPKHFSHVGHLRLVWLYLQNNDTQRTTELVCTGIKAYADSLGATDKFHLTISNALVQIMAQRVATLAPKDWDAFLAANSDLVEDAVSVLTKHYSRDLLFSDTARTTLVQPDILDL